MGLEIVGFQVCLMSIIRLPYFWLLNFYSFHFFGTIVRLVYAFPSKAMARVQEDLFLFMVIGFGSQDKGFFVVYKGEMDQVSNREEEIETIEWVEREFRSLL